MKLSSAAIFLALSASSASAATECITDPQRGQVCRTFGGAKCSKLGVVGYIDPWTNLYRQFDSNDKGGLYGVVHPPLGKEFVPGSEYVQFTKYKKKARIIIRGFSTTELVCDWICKTARSSDAYVEGYCGAKLQPAGTAVVAAPPPAPPRAAPAEPRRLSPFVEKSEGRNR